MVSGRLVIEMTTHISNKSKIQTLTPDLRFDLIERINTSNNDLATLLDMLGKEIEKLGLVDGYLINLRDAESENLISLKVHLTPEFHFLEETYYRYKVPLVQDSLNVSVKAYHSRGIVQCDISNGSTVEKQLLNLWKLNEITAIAILDDDDFSQPPIGTILLLQEKGHIDEQIFFVLEQLISVFYRPLRNALEYAYLKEHRERYEAATAQHSRLLEFIVEMNNLTAPEKIYDMFSSEVFRLFPFSGIGFFLLENNLLVNKKVISGDPLFNDIAAEWESYLVNKPYVLDTTDGGVSHTFIRNTTLMFDDVQTIISLPMSEKDRQTMKIMRTPRTMLITPIRYQNKPIGVVVFYSLANMVKVTEAETHLFGNLSSFLGAAITNGKNYTMRDVSIQK
jgi:two-component system, cell cycle response regulator